MEMETLRELYVEELKDLYDAEKQLIKAIPTMVKNASNAELSQAFSAHLVQTQNQAKRLEQIFESLGERPDGKKCKGMQGLIEEAKELLEEDPQEDVLDAGLIAKAQHVEHYEIAGYGTVRAYAVMLGETEHAQLLQETLDEEKLTDELLTRIAESSVNVDATIGDAETSRGAERELPRKVAAEKSAGSRAPARKKNTGRDARA
jgi:ferritin-like metal-binding protein YciE